MKSKLAFALFLVAMLPAVSGSQEVVEMGPYNVSFDLGDLNYSVYVSSTDEGETYGGALYTDQMIEITNIENDDIVIKLRSYKERQQFYFGDTFYMEPIFMDDDLYIRMLDNREVVLMVAGEHHYWIEYALESNGWKDADNTFTADRVNDKNAYQFGDTYIIIWSLCDWDTTRKLLNTIHIELQ